MSIKWREKLEASLESNKHLPYAKYFQLATVSHDGSPRNRTVVFRKFQDPASITFVTDVRTMKVQDVLANRKAAICWYMPDSREQYRILGDLEIISSMTGNTAKLEARKQAWAELSPGVRSWHVQPRPGQPRSPNPEDFEREPPSGEGPPHENFALAVLEPSSVDYVHLPSNTRLEFRLQDGEWVEQALNP